MAERTGPPWKIVAALIGFTLLSVGYAVVSPPFENPDEMSHAEYAGFLGTRHWLPVVEQDCVRLAFHPPLYHALLAPLASAMGVDAEAMMAGHRVNPAFASTRVILVHGYPDEAFPFSGVSRFVFLGRLLSIVFGLVVLLYTYRLACVMRDDPAAHLLAVVTVAAIPQFEYLSASLNHDTLAAACATAMLFYAVRLAEGLSLALALKCGVALGLGLLTKSSLVPLAVVPALAVVVARGSKERQWRHLAVVYAMAAGIAGWWYVRNATLYGSVLPIVHLHRTTWIGSALLHDGPMDVSYVWGIARQLFESFWFLAGLMNVAGQPWMYWVWGAVSVIVAIGMITLLADRRGLLLVGAWLIVVAGVFQFNLHVYSAQGRYLFVVAAVVGLGMARSLALLPTSVRSTLSGVLVAVLSVLAVGCFVLSFRPTYAMAEARERPDDVETARLFCRNEYTQLVRVAGGQLNGLTLRGRRVSSGDFSLEVLIRRDPDGEVLRRGSLSSAALGLQIADARISLDPLQTTAGETYFVTVRAPAATPISKPALRYSVRDTASENFTINGVKGRGHLLLREDYE